MLRRVQRSEPQRGAGGAVAAAFPLPGPFPYFGDPPSPFCTENQIFHAFPSKFMENHEPP